MHEWLTDEDVCIFFFNKILKDKMKNLLQREKCKCFSIQNKKEKLIIFLVVGSTGHHENFKAS